MSTTLRVLLERDGYSVVEASNGVDALELVQGGEPVDLILLDFQMPGLDGIQVCERLKADPETEGIPVLIATGNGSREVRIRGMEAGATDLLLKPLDMAGLRLGVRNAIKATQL